MGYDVVFDKIARTTRINTSKAWKEPISVMLLVYAVWLHQH